ncbi:hypothetical protein EKH55_3108 [Sinorhizobium alkalisoli]|nr:hypothetical protein EKH55_3108 [Sinorhizobium alkalisoli]
MRDFENRRTESTFPSTIGNGVRGHSRIDGEHASKCNPASV